MKENRSVTVAVVVAHPDDETIWTGGTLLQHPNWNLMVVSLCRGDDPDRAPKFFRAVSEFKAEAYIGKLDDGPAQKPLPQSEVEQTILSLLPQKDFDIVMTHSPYGEYTRHLRHEETSQAVVALWATKQLFVKEVWMFAYEDGGKRYSPKPIKTAHRYVHLPIDIWQKKQRIITDLYGFLPDSFEADAASEKEAFWCFRSPDEFNNWQFISDRRKK